MTGARRFSLSSPDWGQAHLSLDAIVAYVDDELSPGAQVRAQAHLDGCGECRAEVGAQRQARTALRGAGGPCLPSSLLRSLRSIPVETELPPMPPGLGVTADGQFVLLRDVPRADPGAGPGAARASHPHLRLPRPSPGGPGSRPGRGAAPVLPPGADRRGVGPRAGRTGRRRAGRPGRCAGARGPERSPRWRRPGGAAPARPAVAGRPRARHHGGRRVGRPRGDPGGPRCAPARPAEPHPGCVPPGSLSAGHCRRRRSDRQRDDPQVRVTDRPRACASPLGYADFTAAAAGWAR